jgi:hypothetical protein
MAIQLWKGVGRVLSTITSPIFDIYIPKLKASAFYKRMDMFLEQNPNATEAEQLAFARRLTDSIDNRFGEMNQDNIMWNKTMKQSLQVGLTSYSWTLGTMREIGGGAADLARGRFTPRSEYLLGLLIMTPILNSIYQYMMTGEPPKDIQDVLAPRTGGTTPATTFKPQEQERARLPGYIKDLYGWYFHPGQELYNKFSPFAHGIADIATQKDWRGDPLSDPKLGWQGALQASLKTILESFTPISIESLSQQKKGTGIPAWQRLAGISPATADLQDPEGSKAGLEAVAEKAWIRKLYHDMDIAKARGDDKKAADIQKEINARNYQQKVKTQAAKTRAKQGAIPVGGIQ